MILSINATCLFSYCGTDFNIRCSLEHSECPPFNVLKVIVVELVDGTVMSMERLSLTEWKYDQITHLQVSAIL